MLAKMQARIWAIGGYYNDNKDAKWAEG